MFNTDTFDFRKNPNDLTAQIDGVVHQPKPGDFGNANGDGTGFQALPDLDASVQTDAFDFCPDSKDFAIANGEGLGFDGS